jgi:hypothetical protein
VTILNLFSKLNWLQKTVLVGLFCFSNFLVVLRTIWLYEPSYVWFSYQVWHFILFIFTIWLVENRFNYLKVIIASLSFLIAFIPYDTWYCSIVLFDSSQLSSLTSNLHISLRILYEFGIYFALQIMIFWGTHNVLKRSVNRV